MMLEIPKINSSELVDNLDSVRDILSEARAIVIDHNGNNDMVLVDIGMFTKFIDLLNLSNDEPNNKEEENLVKPRVGNVIPFRRRF